MRKIIGKILGVTFVAALAAMTCCQSAQALPVTASAMRSEMSDVIRVWDNCGVGFHRNSWNQCVSNYVNDARGCPPGFHLGYQVHRCVPNR